MRALVRTPDVEIMSFTRVTISPRVVISVSSWGWRLGKTSIKGCAMKIINLPVDDERWAKLKVLADRDRRSVKAQASLYLEAKIDEAADSMEGEPCK